LPPIPAELAQRVDLWAAHFRASDTINERKRKKTKKTNRGNTNENKKLTAFVIIFIAAVGTIAPAVTE
jgi:hypothetical protein